MTGRKIEGGMDSNHRVNVLRELAREHLVDSGNDHSESRSHLFVDFCVDRVLSCFFSNALRIGSHFDLL
jgi:hypothetical protein